MRTVVRTSNAPAPTAPYSQGIISGGRTLYVSGQGPIDAETGAFVIESFAQQCDLTLRNVEAVVEAAGATLAQVVKVNVYLSDWSHREEYNAIYQRFFSEPRPARTTTQCMLPGFDIEIDCIVALDS